MANDIFKIIQDHLAKRLGIDEEEKSNISRETTFDELNKEYKFDSLDRIEFVMEIEAYFSVSIPDDVFERMVTLGDLENTLKNLIDAH